MSEQAAEYFSQGQLVSVLTSQPIDRFLDYKAPENGVFLGQFVVVPLGPRKVIGCVWGAGEGSFDYAKIRNIDSILDVPAMRPEMQSFLSRVAAYTLTPMSQMLRMATRAPGLANPPSMQKVYALGDVTPPKLTQARARVLDVLKGHGGLRFTLKELSDLAAVSTSVVKGLVGLGAVLELQTPRDAPYAPLDYTRSGKALTQDQNAAASAISASLAKPNFEAFLLKGVTGSGKTEVYLEAVAACLKRKQQALVLLPEIALTAEFLDRVEARFGARPAEWHSGVTMTERRRCWRMVAEGGASLVVGARSALYLPFENLGLVVVDEEHDSSYKQEDGVLYSARDMAVMRASLCDAKVVLASATPSLETWQNAQSGKYKRLDLRERYGHAVLPELSFIDMRQEETPSNEWISPSLVGSVRERLANSEQSLLFLNRRGYAPITQCRCCGFQIGCPECDARLVEHRFHARLMCHQCGHSEPKPQTCPSCGIHDRMAPIGPGVERLAEEAKEKFPDARLAVLSSDMAMSARALKEHIRSIAQGEADIIIGTQIVAKGHNFPLLTLVGVIDADLGLHGGDLRAAERSFQLLRQVAGRAGRADKKGQALLQTYQPDHPVMKSIIDGDDEEFWAAEAQARQEAGVPPFGRLAGIVVSSTDMAQAANAAQDLARHSEVLRKAGADVFGPAPAPIARIRGRHRFRLLVKAPKTVQIQPLLQSWRDTVQIKGQLRISIDIDPLSFY